MSVDDTRGVPFAYEWEHAASRTVLKVSGELDVAVASQFQRAVELVLATRPPERLDLDIRGLTFLDSHGVACFVALRKAAAAASVSMTVTCGPRDGIAGQMFHLSGVEGLFDMRWSTEADPDQRL